MVIVSVVRFVLYLFICLVKNIIDNLFHRRIETVDKMRTIKRDRTLKTGNRHHLPIATGPYPNVGYIDIMTGTDESDCVLARLLYPGAQQTADPKEHFKKWPSWYPHDQYKRGYLSVIKITWSPLVTLLNYLGTDVFIPTVENLEPLRENGPMPVIIFSHGLASCRTTYSSICYELASYGFFVFVLEHREQSACASFYPNKDGPDQFKWIGYKHFKEFKDEIKERNEQLDTRVEDIKRLIGLIESLQNGRPVDNILEPKIDNQRFAGLFDLNKLTVMGHSFGAATSLRTLYSIESVKLGICLDTWLYPLKDFDPNLVKKPVLFVNMETFQNNNNLTVMRKFIATDGTNTQNRKVLTIKKAQHSDQSDVPFTMGTVLKRILMMNSAVDPFLVHDLTTALTLQFISDKLQMNLEKDKNEFIEKGQDHLAEGIPPIE